ncbi:MAG: tetratricopeptide repeat protein [Chloroflexota bacterium]
MAGNEQQFQQAMNQGHSAAWDQDWKDAAAFYKQALKEFPDHPKALSSLGLALYQLQDYKTSLIHYQKAAKVSPSDPMPVEKAAELYELLGNVEQAAETRMRAAEIYVQNRDVNKAIELWAKVVNQVPEHLMAHSRLAMVYEKMKQPQQAVHEYLAVASIFQAHNDVPKAIQAATRAQQVMPESQEPARALSMIQAGQRLPRPARPNAVTSPLKPPQSKLLLDKGDGDAVAQATIDPIAECRQKALAVMAGLLFEQDDARGGAASSRRGGLQALVDGIGAAGSGKQIDQTKVLLHLSQAIDLQSKGKHDKALEELQRVIDAGLDHPALHFNMGLLLWESERLEPAVKHLQRIIAHADYMLGARLLLGQVFANMGKAQDAAVQMLEALKLADAQMVSASQAEALRRSYDPLIEALSQQPDADLQKRLYNNIRELLLRSNWREQLMNAREQLPPVDAGSPPLPLADIMTEGRSSQVVETIASINQLARAGHYRTAMEYAFIALKDSPTYLPLHATMADLLLRQEHLQGAIGKYKIIARSYAIRGEAVRAIASYRRILELSPLDMEARNQLINLLVSHGQLEQAVEEYLQLVDVHYSLADLVSARTACDLALRISEQNPGNKAMRIRVLRRMADIDQQSLDWRQALRSYEQIRALQPDDDQASAGLIELNVRLGQEAQAIKELDSYIGAALQAKQREKAIKVVEQLIADNPDQPMLKRRLAELYRQAGRIPDAIEQLDAAGELFLQKKNKSAAAEAISAILTLNPSNAADYQQLLAQIKSG